MEKVGSEVALWKVPARPFYAAGSYLHAKLVWHLGTVYCIPGITVFIEARSLDSNAPTWNKRSSELLVLARGAMCAQARSHVRKHSLGISSSARVVLVCRVSASNHSNEVL